MKVKEKRLIMEERGLLELERAEPPGVGNHRASDSTVKAQEKHLMSGEH